MHNRTYITNLVRPLETFLGGETVTSSYDSTFFGILVRRFIDNFLTGDLCPFEDTFFTPKYNTTKTMSQC